jgi:hypothetical protein
MAIGSVAYFLLDVYPAFWARGDGPGDALDVLGSAALAGDGDLLLGLLFGPHLVAVGHDEGGHGSGVEARGAGDDVDGTERGKRGQPEFVAEDDRGGGVSGLALEVLRDERRGREGLREGVGGDGGLGPGDESATGGVEGGDLGLRLVSGEGGHAACSLPGSVMGSPMRDLIQSVRWAT